MSVNISDLAITSLETIQAYHVTTDAYLFTLDELQNATIAQTEETQDITGRQGRLLSRLKRNKQATISASNGMVSHGLLELQTGNSFANKTTEVQWSEDLVITSNTATTSYKAYGTAGAEIMELWIKDSNGFATTKLEQAATAAAGKFAYAPATKTLTFYAGAYTDNTEIHVIYKRNIAAAVLENHSDSYSEKCKLYVDALAEDKCGNVYHVQIYFPKAEVSGEFSWEMGDNQTIHNFEATALSGACGAAATFWTYTVFGANAEDAA